MTDNLVHPKSYKDSYGWDIDGDGAYDYLWRNGNVVEGDRRLPSIAQDSLNTFYNNRTNWWKYASELDVLLRLMYSFRAVQKMCAIL